MPPEARKAVLSSFEGEVRGFHPWDPAIASEALREACEVCGAGPTGRCDPPDDYDGECPHNCSPER